MVCTAFTLDRSSLGELRPRPAETQGWSGRAAGSGPALWAPRQVRARPGRCGRGPGPASGEGPPGGEAERGSPDGARFAAGAPSAPGARWRGWRGTSALPKCGFSGSTLEKQIRAKGDVYRCSLHGVQKGHKPEAAHYPSSEERVPDRRLVAAGVTARATWVSTDRRPSPAPSSHKKIPFT